MVSRWCWKDDVFFSLTVLRRGFAIDFIRFEYGFVRQDVISFAIAWNGWWFWCKFWLKFSFGALILDLQCLILWKTLKWQIYFGPISKPGHFWNIENQDNHGQHCIRRKLDQINAVTTWFCEKKWSNIKYFSLESWKANSIAVKRHI